MIGFIAGIAAGVLTLWIGDVGFGVDPTWQEFVLVWVTFIVMDFVQGIVSALVD